VHAAPGGRYLIPRGYGRGPRVLCEGLSYLRPRPLPALARATVPATAGGSDSTQGPTAGAKLESLRTHRAPGDRLGRRLHRPCLALRSPNLWGRGLSRYGYAAPRLSPVEVTGGDIHTYRDLGRPAAPCSTRDTLLKETQLLSAVHRILIPVDQGPSLPTELDVLPEINYQPRSPDPLPTSSRILPPSPLTRSHPRSITSHTVSLWPRGRSRIAPFPLSLHPSSLTHPFPRSLTPDPTPLHCCGRHLGLLAQASHHGSWRTRFQLHLGKMRQGEPTSSCHRLA